MERHVLVTGANSGIGLASAIHLANLGFSVIGSVRSQDKAATLKTAAVEAGVDIEPLVLNLTDTEACERELADRALFGLVNNAGFFNMGTIEDVPVEDARRQLEAMVIAPMRLAQLVLPTMRERRDGRIVNVSSALPHVPGPLTGWYQATKQALSAASNSLRMEAASYDVEVVLVEPGAVDTAIWNKGEADLQRRRTGSPYEQAYDRALTIVQKTRGRAFAPATVATVIGEALTAGQPKALYRVNPDASAVALAGRLLPPAVRDRLARIVAGL